MDGHGCFSAFAAPAIDAIAIALPFKVIEIGVNAVIFKARRD